MITGLKRRVRGGLGRLFLMALKDPEVQKDLWKSVNRPEPGNNGSRALAADPWVALWESASRDTARYIEDKMVDKPHFDNRKGLFDRCLEEISLKGLYMEFGCGHKAQSVRYLAGKTGATIHGFDSFEGLPEAWFGEFGKASLSTNGEMPVVPDNVVLHKGWFDASLPDFLERHPGDAAFIHIDCDLYSSTNTVLTLLKSRIRSGTVIQFDEYFNYPGWREHEFKAFQEFIEATGHEYEYLGYASKYAVAVKIV